MFLWFMIESFQFKSSPKHVDGQIAIKFFLSYVKEAMTKAKSQQHSQIQGDDEDDSEVAKLKATR